jgi:hypothetical protein
MLRYRLTGVWLLLLTASPLALLAAQGSNIPGPTPERHHRDTVRMAEPLGGYQIRQGMWLSGGLGYGAFESGGSLGGFTGGMEAGWTLSRRLLLGAGTSVWTRGMGRLGASVGTVDLRVRWYPSELAGGLFLTGGWGLGFIHLTDQLANDIMATGTGFRIGLGYDFRVASGVSITPFGSGSKINTNENGDHMSAEVWQLGLGVTVH